MVRIIVDELVPAAMAAQPEHYVQICLQHLQHHHCDIYRRIIKVAVIAAHALPTIIKVVSRRRTLVSNKSFRFRSSFLACVCVSCVCRMCQCVLVGFVRGPTCRFCPFLGLCNTQCINETKTNHVLV